MASLNLVLDLNLHWIDEYTLRNTVLQHEDIFACIYIRLGEYDRSYNYKIHEYYTIPERFHNQCENGNIIQLITNNPYNTIHELVKTTKIDKLVIKLTDYKHKSINIILNEIFSEEIYHLFTNIHIVHDVNIGLLNFVFNKFNNLQKISIDSYNITISITDVIITSLICFHNITECNISQNNYSELIKQICEYNKSINNTLCGICMVKIKSQLGLSKKYYPNNKELYYSENEKHIKNKYHLIKKLIGKIHSEWFLFGYSGFDY